jgi:hypothetical protein
VALEIGGLMIQQRLLDEGQLRQAREVQLAKGGDLARIAVDMGLVDDQRLATALSQILGLPKVDLSRLTVEPAAVAKIPRRLAARLAAFPCVLRDGGGTLWVALANPTDESARLALERSAGCQVKLTVAGFREIEAAIERHYAWEDLGEDLSIDLAEDDQPIKLTDMSGRTLMTLAPSQPRQVVPLELAAPPPVALSPEDQRLLSVLQEGIGRSGLALQAVLDLCVEKGVLNRDALAARSRK